MKKKNLIKGLILLAVILNLTTSFGQSVVINEVITDPQQDWSSNGFDGTIGASSITNTDEWLELYIKADGLDLTSWTIELIDGSNVIGDLTVTGAFDVSNYISSNGGTFTNTKNGDFLVLGNPDGSGAMNNDVIINLKNNVGSIIDTVTLGGSAGEAPNGAAASVTDESVQRIPNGTDTNVDSDDFIQGTASLGKINPTLVWTGSTSNDWSTAANWSSAAIPVATDNVQIPSGLTNYPTISTGSTITVNNIIIDSGASLIAEGTSNVTGNVTYKREVNFVSGNLKGWFLMASPVIGQDYNDTYITANDIAISGSNRGIATYITNLDSWSYHQGTASATFTSGLGYSIKRQTNTGTLSFKGSVNTNDAGINAILSVAGNRFNLLGNPYNSYLSSAVFLNNETSISETKTMWIFNQALGINGSYEVKTVGQDFKIAPGQGFFVKANSTGGTFNFTESNQIHNTDTFQKGSGNKTNIKLSITDGEINQYVQIYYIKNATAGFDVGYEGELFGGSNLSFAIYSQLVTDNQDKKYQVQSLPKDNYENMVIPIGVNAISGKNLTFSTETLNLPTNLKVFLEDRETSTFIRLDELNSKYKVSLGTDLNGTGRFYLHTTQSVLSTKLEVIENISIYKSTENTLKFIGLHHGDINVSLSNILGKILLNTNFNSNGVREISLPKLAPGVYIVKLRTEKGELNKKIVIE